MKIQETQRFRKSVKTLDKKVLKKIQKQFALFFQNPTHPSLNTEKLEPRINNIWSFRVDRNHRVIFTYNEPDIILLLNIGPHDIYKKL